MMFLTVYLGSCVMCYLMGRRQLIKHGYWAVGGFSLFILLSLLAGPVLLIALIILWFIELKFWESDFWDKDLPKWL